MRFLDFCPRFLFEQSHLWYKNSLRIWIKEDMNVTFRKIVKTIPVEKREKLSDKLVDFLLKSKKGDEMPSGLANTMLNQWRQGSLKTEAGLAALLEAAVLLESEKTMDFLEQELQLVDVARAVREAE